MADDDYERALRDLQIELVKMQRHLITAREKVLVIFEGRDAAGKDGTIKRIVEHMSPRETRVVALGTPSERDNATWYFQRYVPYLPAAAEFVLFNRSWYNRAGVERVMNFCTKDDTELFMNTVGEFEHMLVLSGIRLFKYYLDITKKEQRERLEDRKQDPLKQWKISPIDEVAHERWDQYSKARDEMLTRTHSPSAPWTIVRADNKESARLNVLRDLLSHLDYDDKQTDLLVANTEVVFRYPGGPPTEGMLAP